MSLVQAIITEDFGIIAADKRSRKGNVINDDCNKLIKVNEHIAFGCTGTLEDNMELFHGFCQISPEKGLVASAPSHKISFKEFVNILIKRYEVMRIKHFNPFDRTKYKIQSLVCGYNGDEFEIVVLGLTDDPTQFSGVSGLRLNKNEKHKTASAGKPEHYAVLNDLLEQYKPATISQCKNILKSIFLNGSDWDDTINSNICFLEIKKE